MNRTNGDVLKRLSEGPQLALMDNDHLMPLPQNVGKVPAIRSLSEEERKKYECSLDGVSALCIPHPTSVNEEEKLVHKFLSGLNKLLSKDDNWTFWQPLILSLENCVGCNICSSACPIYLASGGEEIYRPIYRAEIIRRIRDRYLGSASRANSWSLGAGIELNWTLVARLAELAYRCTLCRRCSQVCPMGVDNGLIARELRKLFSQEMGIAPKELHEMGTVPLLNTPAGCTREQIDGMIKTVEDGIEEKIGRRIDLPVDRVGADFLFIQTSLDSPSWLKCPECFAIIFDRAGLDWTISSELGFGGSNFGLWYDDIQFARIVYQQIEIARKLKVKKIILGECGHAYKAMAGMADGIVSPDNLLPRMSWLPLVADIVESGVLELDLGKNDFLVTLHDPCNIARQMGMVSPQRRILSKVCSNFRETEPNGVHNYCCGGGSGLILMQNTNFPEWRAAVAGKFKMKQVMQTFDDCLTPDTRKYVCAPCFTCKLQFQDLFNYYDAWNQFGIMYGGLIELVVNAMNETKKPIIEWGPPAGVGFAGGSNLESKKDIIETTVENQIQLDSNVDEYPKGVVNLVETEVCNVIEEEMKKTVQELLDEQRKATQQILEEHKIALREVVEQGKQAALTRVVELQKSILKACHE